MEIIGKTNYELRIDPEMAKFSEKQRENVFTTGKPENNGIPLYITSRKRILL